MTQFQEIGGEPQLRKIMDTFVDRVFADPMIGFLFHRVSKRHIQEFEYQHAAAFLGADIEYKGRPLKEAHEPHRIQGGQFSRRKQILQGVLREYRVPENVQQAWLEHTESLRQVITGGAECEP